MFGPQEHPHTPPKSAFDIDEHLIYCTKMATLVHTIQEKMGITPRIQASAPVQHPGMQSTPMSQQQSQTAMYQQLSQTAMYQSPQNQTQNPLVAQLVEALKATNFHSTNQEMPVQILSQALAQVPAQVPMQMPTQISRS